jgi:hypothetical protein
VTRPEHFRTRLILLGWALIVAAVVVPAPVAAQDSDLAFDGVARTGDDTRPVRFRFFCSSNNGPNLTGVLSVELEVLGFEQLRPVFDFDPFEGPDAHAGALTLLRTNGVRSKAEGRFTATGSIIPSGSGEAFMLEVTASRREAGPLRKLAAALRPLMDAPGRLEWRQGNAKNGGVPLVAGLDLTKAQGDELKAGVGACVDAR